MRLRESLTRVVEWPVTLASRRSAYLGWAFCCGVGIDRMRSSPHVHLRRRLECTRAQWQGFWRCRTDARRKAGCRASERAKIHPGVVAGETRQDGEPRERPRPARVLVTCSATPRRGGSVERRGPRGENFSEIMDRSTRCPAGTLHRVRIARLFDCFSQSQVDNAPRSCV